MNTWRIVLFVSQYYVTSICNEGKWINFYLFRLKFDLFL